MADEIKNKKHRVITNEPEAELLNPWEGGAVTSQDFGRDPWEVDDEGIVVSPLGALGKIAYGTGNVLSTPSSAMQGLAYEGNIDTLKNSEAVKAYEQALSKPNPFEAEDVREGVQRFAEMAKGVGQATQIEPPLADTYLEKTIGGQTAGIPFLTAPLRKTYEVAPPMGRSAVEFASNQIFDPIGYVPDSILPSLVGRKAEQAAKGVHGLAFAYPDKQIGLKYSAERGYTPLKELAWEADLKGSYNKMRKQLKGYTSKLQREAGNLLEEASEKGYRINPEDYAEDLIEGVQKHYDDMGLPLPPVVKDRFKEIRDWTANKNRKAYAERITKEYEAAKKARSKAEKSWSEYNEKLDAYNKAGGAEAGLKKPRKPSLTIENLPDATIADKEKRLAQEVYQAMEEWAKNPQSKEAIEKLKKANQAQIDFRKETTVSLKQLDARKAALNRKMKSLEFAETKIARDSDAYENLREVRDKMQQLVEDYAEAYDPNLAAAIKEKNKKMVTGIEGIRELGKLDKAYAFDPKSIGGSLLSSAVEDVGVRAATSIPVNFKKLRRMPVIGSQMDVALRKALLEGASLAKDSTAASFTIGGPPETTEQRKQRLERLKQEVQQRKELKKQGL